MPSVQECIKIAGAIADEVITHSIHGDLLTVQWESADIKRIKDRIQQALDIEPDNPHLQYINACLIIAQGEQETGLDGIRAIARAYPSCTKAQGHAAYPHQWFSPFYYPAWHEHRTELPEHFARLPHDGTLLVSMRDSIYRIVSFFRHCEPGYCVLSKNTPTDIDIKILDTPFGMTAGVYLIIDPGKRSGRFSETILPCDTTPAGLHDMSVTGHWLLRLLADQSYTFIFLHDTQTGTVYRKKHYFNARQKKLLVSISKQLSKVSPATVWDRDTFLKAQQYYMQHVNIDTFFQ